MSPIQAGSATRSSHILTYYVTNPFNILEILRMPGGEKGMGGLPSFEDAPKAPSLDIQNPFLYESSLSKIGASSSGHDSQ